MARISFKITEIEKLVLDMEKSNEFLPTMNELFDLKAKFLKKGVAKTEDTLPITKDEIDYTKVEKSFHLVKDHGVYMLSNARNKTNDKPASETKLIAYAKGFNPDVDEDWYEYSRDVIGGDDCVIDIPLSWYYVLIKAKPNAKVFAINFGAKSISLIK